ncbi:MAG: hypothetical protein IKS48_01495 [Eubacterium sp.]|nr:hypothetical protein [Lachnospiraceae bacterium]MBR6402041.1 hypothetical protein [Eubacterium sp.]
MNILITFITALTVAVASTCPNVPEPEKQRIESPSCEVILEEVEAALEYHATPAGIEFVEEYQSSGTPYEESDTEDNEEESVPIFELSEYPSKPIQFVDIYVKNEVICIADTIEEAYQIAEDYDITLKSYEMKVCAFDTGSKSPYEVIEYGKEHGLTPVYLNGYNYLFDITD